MKDFNPRYATLDHWRGVAALAVMVFHGFGAMRGAGLEAHLTLRWLQRLSDFGWFGVHLFFVISGYCIAANIYRLAARGWNARDFFADRLMRVYPAYWAACILAVAVGLVALPFNRGSLAETIPESPSAMLANVLLLEPYLNVDPLLLVSWTLVYEIGFYALVAVGWLSLWESLVFWVSPQNCCLYSTFGWSSCADAVSSLRFGCVVVIGCGAYS